MSVKEIVLTILGLKKPLLLIFIGLVFVTHWFYFSDENPHGFSCYL
jgi:hypothetical protein